MDFCGSTSKETERAGEGKEKREERGREGTVRVWKEREGDEKGIPSGFAPPGKFPNFATGYLKARPSYYKWKIISTAVLTLNFDLDLSKINIWRRRIAKFNEN